MTLEQRAFGKCEAFGDSPLNLEVIFYRPQNRNYDRDNLLARMKSGIDGMCDAFEIDDRRFVSVTIRVGNQIVRNGKVVLLIRRDKNG